eukprot:2002695-Prymnesium_polylepis.1
METQFTSHVTTHMTSLPAGWRATARTGHRRYGRWLSQLQSINQRAFIILAGCGDEKSGCGDGFRSPVHETSSQHGTGKT